MAHFTSELAEQLAPDVVARLIRYARVDTQSDRGSDGTRHPSTPGQLDLLHLLIEELHGLGLTDAALDEEQGFVFATLPATVDGPVETIGLLAHVDVSPDAPAVGVEPIVHRDYDGGVIELPRGGTVLDPERMPELREAVGHDLVSSSGDTLLGADDKAGVAEIMAAVAYLVAHPELPRPTIRVGFTPDEEIGIGSLHFPVETFGARGAYTVDGSTRGELQDETFTAASATITVTGHDVHPGFATGKLVNALRIAARIVAALPSDRLTPETTSGRDGFIHPIAFDGSAQEATIQLIVRDFDDDLLDEHVALLRRTAEEVAATEPRARVEVDVRPQYPNMRRFVEQFPQVVEAAEAALRAEGIEPLRVPIRGGTDGSLISARGLPTPNLFTGGHEYHSVREWASVQDMAASAATLVRLAETWTTERFRPQAAAPA